MQLVRVRHVVHEQQQLVRARFERLEHRRHRRPVLADESVPVATVRSMPTPVSLARCHCPQPLYSDDSGAGPKWMWMMSVSVPMPSGPV